MPPGQLGSPARGSAAQDEWPAVLRAVLHVVAPLLLEDDVLLFHAVVRDVFVEAELPATQGSPGQGGGGGGWRFALVSPDPEQ